MSQYEAENLILALADSIIELHQLRREVEELREIKKEYYEYLSEQSRASEARSNSILEGILLGVISKPKE